MLNLEINKRFFKQIDYSIIILIYLLSIIGILVIYGSTSSIPQLKTIYIKQTIWLVISTIVFIVILFINYNDLKKILFLLYFANILLLIFLLFFGKAVHGSTSWFAIGSVRFQPSEIMKVITVIFLAMYLSEERDKGFLTIDNFGKPILITLLPMLLILKQPDLGTAIIFMPCLLVMLYLANAKIRPLILFILFLAVSASGVYPFLKTYQKERIFIFLNPGSDSLGKGYNIIQSQIALGSGKLLGKGWGHGTQTEFQFLPEHHTDFIFSSLIEQFGFIGGIFVLFLFYMLIQRSLNIAKESKDFFGSYMVIGLIMIVIVHIIMNIGMTSGLMPVTGIPLPFISYGGSSLLTMFVIYGLIINVKARQYMF